jgi:hypothetical protein
MAAPTIISITDLQTPALELLLRSHEKGTIKYVTAEWNSGDITIGDVIAAPGANKRIAVLQLSATANTSQVWNFYSGANYLGRIDMAGGTVVMPYTGVPWFLTGTNEALRITPNVATVGSCRVTMAYVILPTA